MVNMNHTEDRKDSRKAALPSSGMFRTAAMSENVGGPNSKRESAPKGEDAGNGSGSAQTKSGEAAAPKKKRIVAVFRPQNSRSGMVQRRTGMGQAAGGRSSQGQGGAGTGRSGQPRRPQDGASRPQSGTGSAQRGQQARRPAGGTAARRPAEQKPRVHFVGAMTGPDKNPEDFMPKTSAGQASAETAASAPAAQAAAVQNAEVKTSAAQAAPAAVTAPVSPVSAAAAPASGTVSASETKAAAEHAQTAAAKPAEAPASSPASAPESGSRASEGRSLSEGKTVTQDSASRRYDSPRRDGGSGRDGSSQRSDSRRDSGSRDSSGRSDARREGGYRSDRGSDRSGSSDRGGYRRDGSSQGGGYRRDGSSQGGGYRRDGSSQGGGYRRDGSQGGGYSNSRPSGGSGRPGMAAGSSQGRGFSGGKGAPAAGKGRGGDFSDNMGAKSGDKQRRSSSRKTEREKEKEKFSRFDQDDRVQNGSRKKKDPNRAGAFHRPEAVKAQPEEEQIKTIILPDTLTLRDLADKMKLQPSALIKKLFLQGKMVTVNQELTYEDAEAIALDYDILCEHEVKKDLIAELLQDEEDPEESLVSRAPVVCVMGHVDHGKTSLLDAIRNTHVSDREAGGITQHIGASVIHYEDRSITFLDTPGHEAFTAMRMRGANSTDIAVLVVAADDGVMPQTIEAINHAKAAGIEIIVAINKIDKPSANIDRVKQELTEYGLVAEDWGGSTTMVPVSAKTHEGIDTLLEMILLTADVLELKANPDRRARGVVIEAKLDKGRGPVASLLVQKGTLHVGDPICAGSCHGKVRAMTDDKGRAVKEAGPSTPVEVIGFSDVPGAGEIFLSPETEKEAKSFAETFITVGREKMLEETKSRMSLDDLFSQIKEGSLKDLNLIVKADVQGSVEALKQSLEKLSNDEVVVKIIHSGVGAINESDVTLAGASNAIIIGFNVRPDALAKSTAEHEGVEIKLYRVIYDAINDVESAMKGMLEPIYEEQVTGHVEVRMIFKASGVGNIAGSYVLDGVVQRGSKARITRGKDQIFDGEIASLKRFKDDVKEVKAGYECGLVFEGFNDIAEGDQVEVYKMVEVPRT